MSVLNSLADAEDLQKSRRSLLLLSYSCLVLASLSIETDRIVFLGLEVLFSKARTIALLRLAIFVVLMIYLLRAIPLASSALLNFLRARHSSWEKETVANFPEEPSNGEEYWHDPEPWEEQYALGKTKREKLRGAVEAAGVLFGSFAIILLDFLYPIVIGFLVLFFPESLSVLISWMTKEM